MSIAGKYAYPDTNLATALTATVGTGTVDSTYGVSNLGNGNPSLPTKFSSTTIALVWDMLSATAVKMVALLNCNLDGTVTWQGNSSNSWTSPAYAKTFTVPTIDEDGFQDNPWLDTSAVSSYRYWRLLVEDNTDDVVIGDIWMGSELRTLPSPHAPGTQRTEAPKVLSMETAAGVQMTYDLGARVGQISSVQVITTRATGIPQLQSWFRAARGRAKVFPLMIDPLGNNCQLVRFDQDSLVVAPLGPFMAKVEMAFRETARGLAW